MKTPGKGAAVPELKRLGAEGILELSVNKIIP